MDARKPPAKAQTREPWTFRFTDAERTRITGAALTFGVGEPTVFGRHCVMLGLSLLERWPELEASLRTTGQVLEQLRPYYAALRGAA